MLLLVDWSLCVSLLALPILSRVSSLASLKRGAGTSLRCPLRCSRRMTPSGLAKVREEEGAALSLAYSLARPPAAPEPAAGVKGEWWYLRQ
ncbi:hypothetical protein E2C01_088555 [Portunus trituberculatus]|uniref:Secreted protein n=1 Tax=Portunus trituberculatus TaxID=210409 RepID=A0A5B7JEZ2_PORTR|nr:hypothetical protein [Portunus trituberculatus]